MARAVTGVELRPGLLVGNLTVIPAHQNFAAFSPTYLAVFLICVSAVPVGIYLAGRGAARLARPLQSADVNLYLLYIFLVVVIAFVIQLVQSY